MKVDELLELKNIEYKARGRDYTVRCLNPEHEDTNPSMNIDKITGIFHCYSCGYAGDIYELFKVNKDNFLDIKIEMVKQKVLELLNTNILSMPLDTMYIGEDYRNISKTTLRKFSAFTTESIKGMEGRIVFPITNINRDIIAFQGRYMYSDLEPKYKIYPEHSTLPLYPSVVSPIKNSIILVEGLFDMINLHDKGLHNAVCTFGTAFGSVKNDGKKTINLNKLLNFKYQGITHIVIMYDGDEAGKRAARNLGAYINNSFVVHTIDLPDGKDPGSLSSEEVKKLYGELYEDSSS